MPDPRRLCLKQKLRNGETDATGRKVICIRGKRLSRIVYETLFLYGRRRRYSEDKELVLIGQTIRSCSCESNLNMEEAPVVVVLLITF